MNAGNLQSNSQRKNATGKNKKTLRARFIKGGIALLARILLRLKFENVENIPPEGGLIIVTNHMSRVDTPVLLLNPVRFDLAALVAKNYQDHAIIHFIVSAMPHIWIDRTRADFSAMAAATEYLKQGGSLGVAPEGTRSRTGALIEGKSGAVLLAVRAGVPIVAVGIAGSEDFQKNLFRLRSTPVTARYSKPFTLPPLDREDRGGSLQRATEEIMCRIAAQLPEKYHGFYANHPRLQVLLAEQESSSI